MGVVVLSSFLTVAALLAMYVFALLVENLALRHAPEKGPLRNLTTGFDLAPQNCDPWLYASAPFVAIVGVSWAMVVIPFSDTHIASNLKIGLFYFIVVVDFVVLAVAMGGWGANTPATVESCYRIVAQLIAYVIPLGLAIIGPIMMARSLETLQIVRAQEEAGLWYIVTQPLGFGLYVLCALMQSYRQPFLEPFADRIQGGVLSGYGGWKIILWRVSFSALLFVVSAMGAILFLGGHSGPSWLPPILSMFIKTYALLFFIVWIGTYMRKRSTAEMLALSWKCLIPLGLINVLIVGGLILLGVGQEPFETGAL